ncbi:MAG: hypothetical protein IJL87_06840 [Clostridia bacterium]|nr:hypothetical protein [Clostridia bacterium]
MSRTTIEIPMKTNNVDEVLNIIAMKMGSAGYKQKIVDGETVWAKGDGVILKMQCVGAVFTGKSVVIQGWMKDAVTGESSLDGFVAMLPKKKMKKQIDDICNQIISRNL